jgi:TPR repeat protein
VTQGFEAFDEALVAWELGDSDTALRLWQDAANAGDVAAQMQIGLCYELGLGVDTDPSLAAQYYSRAAAVGQPEAQFSLGTLYRDGRGVAQDYGRALELFRAAIGSGFVKAYTALASMLQAGWGAPANASDAARLYRLAAHRGDVDAQVMLGALYLKGEGVEQDYRVSFHWLSLAANSGDPEAQFNVGMMYARGDGVQQDFVAAHQWMNLSKVGGYGRAEGFLTVIASEMAHDEIQRAIKMAQAFSPVKQAAGRVAAARSGELRQMLSSTFGSVAREAERAIKIVLGEVIYSRLQPTTCNFLLKFQAELFRNGTEAPLTAAVLLTKAFESEFNAAVRGALASKMLDKGFDNYPLTGDPKLLRDRCENDRLTPGQTIRMLKEDSLLRELLEAEGLNCRSIIEVCERVVRLRNEVIHEDFNGEQFARLKDYVLSPNRGALAVLVRRS